ncbi:MULTISPECIES: hypothetical protein [Sphingobacterium]|uniref:hypothetical protein n=1 Tax=Sphingobacterium TaxID=28453 RepID=UPI0008A1DC6C|nr:MULTISPECIES: hypothetical protein [Sphingobacterium]MBB1642700.1 hypothetical protein [Sphingobacterium sp. UME9]OFV09564.1 hypothetical protein HMPREF3127_23150 [Sphingobacterium sp. HMSC13C05]HAL51291.1 hypothetical protein [Sphingobacterium sp.]
MRNVTPEHLSTFSKEISSNDFPIEINRDWLEDLGIKLLIIDPASGNDQFKIRFSGMRYEDGLVGSSGNVPLVIYAERKGAKDIVIFDERKHGYECQMVELKEYSEPIFSKYNDNHGADHFRIYFCSNSSVDFEDEFVFNDKGKIETNHGEFRDLSWLQSNAFDYVVVFLENEHVFVTKLLELELA